MTTQIVRSKKLRGKTRTQQLEEDKVRGSRTQQQFKDDANLNVIMQRYVKSNPRDPHGFALAMQIGTGESGDATSTLTLADALNLVNEGTDRFMELPSDLRDRFGNDPVKLESFLRNPENQEEAYRLNLAVRPETPQKPPPLDVRVVQEDLVVQSGKGPEGP